MTSLMWILVGVVGVFAVIWFLNSRASSSIYNLLRAKVGKIGRAAENHDPVAQMQFAADQAKEEVQKAKNALTQVLALKTNLERQLESKRKDVLRLTSRIESAMETRPDNDPILVQYATELSRAKNDVKGLEASLEGQSALYNRTLDAAKAAGKKIDDIEARARTLSVRIETSKAQAELASLLDSYDPNNINSAVNNASKFEALAEQEIDRNNAKLQVVKEFGNSEVQEFEANEDAKSVLAEMRAKKKTS